jgi:hypothetical protein
MAQMSAKKMIMPIRVPIISSFLRVPADLKTTQLNRLDDSFNGNHAVELQKTCHI